MGEETSGSVWVGRKGRGLSKHLLQLCSGNTGLGPHTTPSLPERTSAMLGAGMNEQTSWRGLALLLSIHSFIHSESVHCTLGNAMALHMADPGLNLGTT